MFRYCSLFTDYDLRIMVAVVLYIVIMSLGWIIINTYKSVVYGHLEVSSLDGEATEGGSFGDGVMFLLTGRVIGRVSVEMGFGGGDDSGVGPLVMGLLGGGVTR